MKKFIKNNNNFISALKYVLILSPVILWSIDSFAGIDLGAGMKEATEPVLKMINTYYPVAIFIAGAIGAFMQQQGDLRDRMLGFAKGALIGGLAVMGVMKGLGVTIPGK